MTHIVREIQLIVKSAADRQEPEREFIKAVIVSHEGNIRVPGHPEKVWCSELGVAGSRIPAINYAVQDIEGLPVILGWVTRPGLEERAIISLDTGVPTTIEFGEYTVGAHAATHEWSSDLNPGLDSIRTFQPAIMMLKSNVSASSLIVAVNPLYYISSGRLLHFPGQQINLTPYLPSAGNVKYVIVYLNRSTNSLAVVSGSEVVTGLLPPRPILPSIYAEPSSLIKLAAGQTGINIATDYTDARNFLGADATTFPHPTQAGQLLYSVNGLEFVAVLPLTNADGIMLNDQGLIMVK